LLLTKIDPDEEIWTKPGFSLTNYNKIVLDRTTNEQLLAFVDRKIGKKYNVDLKEGPVNAVETAAESYAYSYTTWKYTKEAFDFWAQTLRKRLDEAHRV